jgi:7-cyano-7-deazaguanine synthase in queuosine biosynthesis
MGKVLNFPPLSYRYDFSVPNIVRVGVINGTADNSSFVSEHNFFVRDEEIIGLFGSKIDSLHLDWIDLAISVYIADRLSLRESVKNRNNWKRNFSIKIAVRNLEIWQNEDLQSELENVLNYYTDDDWNFEFLPLVSNDRLNSINNKLPIPPAKSPRIALYSGGLDSFAGISQQLYENKDENSFILVSGATNHRQDFQQRQQIKGLIQKYNSIEIIHQTIKFGFNWNNSEHPKEENSQRTRGFVFTTLGAVTALNAGSNTLEIYENGIGAINLPYDNSQVGTMNSRGVNPLVLLRMEKFIEKLIKQDFQIKNLYLFKMKGEMCQHEAVQNLEEIIPLTFSCDGFPVQTAGKPQCGVCTSCLLRRLSLETADLFVCDNGEQYLTDLTSQSSKASFAQLNNLRAMEWQYQIIKNCLGEKDAWQALIIEYPILQTIFSELTAEKDLQIDNVQSKILLLYSRYCAEWENFSARLNHINSKRKAA